MTALTATSTGGDLDARTDARTTEGRSSAVPTTPLHRVVRFELLKLSSQWILRAALLGCVLGPAAYVALVSHRTSLPTDALYGRWMGQSGWAGSLAVLSFAGGVALPLLAGVVSGDVFAAEDRLGTWRHLLVAVRSARRLFWAKTLAALAVTLVLLTALAASSVVGGLVAVGAHPVVGLDGQVIGSGDAAVRVLVAWLSVVPPTAAFCAVGVLASVALGRSPLGLLAPVLLALVLQGLQLLPLPVAVRLALPTSGFVGYRGLLTAPAQPASVWVATAVSLGWAGLATALAHRLLTRRDFTDPAYDGAGRRLVGQALLPLVGLFAATVALLVVATGGLSSGSSRGLDTGIDAPRLERQVAASFAHLYVLQTDQLHRPPVSAAQLHASATCDKGGERVADSGPGADWRCVVTWTLPGATATGTAIYQLDVSADGRYVADGDGPKEVNGYFQLHTTRGDAPNPLWQFDGLVDLLHHVSKGNR